VDRQDLEFEELLVPESVGLPFPGLDLVVCPLKRARADREVGGRQQARTMAFQRLGHLLEHPDS
jgi:hypothetical protein